MRHRFFTRGSGHRTALSTAFVIEAIESRLMLDGTPTPVSTFGPDAYRSGDLDPFQLSTQNVQAGGTISVTYSCGASPMIACSHALLTNVMVDGAVVAATSGTVPLYSYYVGGGSGGQPTPDTGAVITAPSGSHTVTFTIDPNAATEGILAYHDNQGNVYAYDGPWITGEVGYGSYSSAQPFDIAGSGSKLAFMQQPNNASAGDTLKPGVTVAVENLDGSTNTSSTDSVTLALTGSSAALAGTLTEPAVNGIATFSDLSIQDSGDYTLTATDGSDTPVNSSSFTITEGKLVFTAAPHAGSAGAALDPAVKVALEDGKGKIDTDDSSTVVTLTPIGVMSGSPLTGNTATLSDGVATFSGLTLTKGGLYQLQAGDGADTTATSAKFKIGGDHLVFKELPASVDSGAQFDFKILLEDSKNRVVTDSDDMVQFTVSGPGFSSLTQTYALDGGVVVVAGSKLLTPGDFTATAEDLTTVETADASAKLTVKSDHLVFKGLPASVDSGAQFDFKILLEDSKNRVVTDSDDMVQFTVSAPGFSSLTQAYTLDDGVVVVAGSKLLTPGDFTVTAQDLTTAETEDADAKLTVKSVS